MLYNYEGNQFARLVREALTELELPFIARSAGKGSARREALQALSGRTTVPFLVDPNTGVAMGESLDIVQAKSQQDNMLAKVAALQRLVQTGAVLSLVSVLVIAQMPEQPPPPKGPTLSKETENSETIMQTCLAESWLLLKLELELEEELPPLATSAAP